MWRVYSGKTSEPTKLPSNTLFNLVHIMCLQIFLYFYYYYIIIIIIIIIIITTTTTNCN